MTAPGDVPVRDAATVVLLRDGTGDPPGVEAWLLTRVTGMVFAAGMSVFPGGRVDDADEALPFVGDVATMAARFGTSEQRMRSLLGAAVRETFEETGVLLTTPVADLSAHREDVEQGRVSFGALLRDHGLSVDTTLLRPWSRWVTPEGEVRRYDTHFFVARLPEDSVAEDLTTESSAAEWLPVRTAIAQAQAGERGLLPPTMLTLVAVGDHDTVAQVQAAADTTDLEPVRPSLVVAPDKSVSVELPDGRVLLIRPAPVS